MYQPKLHKARYLEDPDLCGRARPLTDEVLEIEKEHKEMLKAKERAEDDRILNYDSAAEEEKQV